MERCAVLLRGVNVGRGRRLAMADLRGLLTAAGYAGVRTLGQSGNVVLSSDLPPDELAADVARRIAAAGLGEGVAAVARTRAELAEVLARDPLGAVATDPRRYQVSFLSAEPAPAVLRSLAEAARGAERVAWAGREVYSWHPDGIHASRLARLLSDRRLGVTATARNWATVGRLLALADAA